MKPFFAAGKLLALFSITALLLTLSASIPSQTLARSSTGYGSIQWTGVAPATTSKPVAVKEHPITEARAKALAKDSHLASRMLHRVASPLPTQHPISYSTPTSSSNWGGYFVQASNISGSYGCFTDTSSPTYDAASWTGVGGVYGTNLAQTGVDQYYQQAWIETYPNPPAFLFSVSVGDEICSEVALDTSNGLWYLNVTDSTTGVYYANEYNFGPDRSSAEWITEAQPGYSVPNFAPITFSSTYWRDSANNWQYATSGSLYQVYLRSPYGGTICPSAETGTSFVNYANAC